MEAKSSKSKNLAYLTLYPDDYDPDMNYPLVIMLHGFGSNMTDLPGLAPAIDPKGYVYISPNGPMEVPIGPGMTGYAWTPLRANRTMEDSSKGTRILQEFLDEILGLYGPAAGQTIVLGFSQGGVMAYQCGLVNPTVFGGIVALSSVTPEPEELEGRLPKERNQPIFISHGIYDDIISVEMARGTKAYLETEGYHPDYNEYPIRHEISNGVLDDLVPWIKKVLPPAA